MENKSDNKPPKVWVLIEGRTGSDNQCLGVAQKLSSNLEILSVDKIGGMNLKYFLQGKTPIGKLTPDWPDILVTGGIYCDETATRIKRLAGNKMFSLKLGNPTNSSYYSDYDLIARFNVPQAERFMPESMNRKTIYTTGVAHKVTSQLVEEGRKLWQEEFSSLPGPKIAVLVGGNVDGKIFTPELARKMGHDLNEWAKKNGVSLIMTTSRRTQEESIRSLTNEITVPAYFYDWRRNDKPNPYYGLLGVADGIIVSGESQSMLTEACSTGKPVYFYPMPELENERHWFFQRALIKENQAKQLDPNISFEHWNYKPLDVTGEIASEVLQRMRQKSQRPQL